MANPTRDRREQVDFLLILEAEARGVSVDSLTTDDIQTLAFGVRLTALSVADPELLQTANSLDDLSELDPSDLVYLETLAVGASSDP